MTHMLNFDETLMKTLLQLETSEADFGDEKSLVHFTLFTSDFMPRL